MIQLRECSRYCLAEPSQVGYARWVTDRTTFAYLADVFVVEGHAGKGLGIWLVQEAQKMPAVTQQLPHTNATQGTLPRLLLLQTRTAQGLYSRHAGFVEFNDKDGQDLRIMARVPNQPIQ